MSNRTKFILGFIFGFAAVALAIVVFRADGSARGPYVSSVTDGDTIEVTNGDTVTDVRLIGIDTPETVMPHTPVMCGGPEAHDFLAEKVLDKDVTIVKGAEPIDDYGRTLAYVYVNGEFINAAIAEAGMARYMTIAPNDKFAPVFEAAVSHAIDANRGIWSECDNAMAWATGQADAP